MRKYAVPSLVTALVLSFGLLVPASAEATVRIRAFGLDICFTGKKNPHGCDSAKVANKNVRVIVVDDDAMADLDKLRGRPLTLEPVVTRKTSGFEAEYSGVTGANGRAAGDTAPAATEGRAKKPE